MIKVYSRSTCAACNRFKKDLKNYGIQFEEILIDQDVDREFILENFPGYKVLPIVDIDGTVYDGKMAELKLNEYKEDFGKVLLNE